MSTEGANPLPDERTEASGPTRASGAPDATGDADAAVRRAADAIEGLGAPDSIGAWRVVRELGRGGFGVVYLAEREQPAQVAAIKLVLPGMDTRSVLARFDAERQALAMMSHPNIAKLYDAGVHNGRPYFAMEYVPGLAITEYCDRNKLSVRDRLAIFQQVCRAVQHAHLKAVIHRDISARNVMVMEVDGAPNAKVIDFGIAKAVGVRLTDMTLDSRPGIVLGNYAYMSPEQTDPKSDVDTRTDVYSLGVLLYELLAGDRPFDTDALRSAGEEGIRKLIREVDPPRPSTRLSTAANAPQVAERRRERLGQLVGKLRGELELIPLMAMRKERDRRYQTPQELATDIDAYLGGRPIRAVPESQWYRARKWARRNARALTAVGISCVAVVGGLTGVGVEYVQYSRQQALTGRANDLNHLIVARLKAWDVDGQADAVTVVDVGRDIVRELDAGRVMDPENRGRLRGVAARIFANSGHSQEAIDQATLAIEDFETLHDDLDPELATALDTRAKAEISTSPALAAKDARRALDMRRRIFRQNSDEVVESLVRCGDIPSDGGTGPRSDLYAQALAVSRSLHPTGDDDTALILDRIADDKAPADALPLYDEAISILTRLHPSGAPRLAATHLNAGSTLADAGEFERALPHLQAALDMWHQCRAPELREAAAMELRLASCLFSLPKQDREGAHLHYLNAAAILRKMHAMGPQYEDQSPLLASTLTSLYQLERASNGKHAEELLAEALAVAKSIPRSSIKERDESRASTLAYALLYSAEARSSHLQAAEAWALFDEAQSLIGELPQDGDLRQVAQEVRDKLSPRPPSTAPRPRQ
jgi:tetratricopeptide (TPR) repeat protein